MLNDTFSIFFFGASPFTVRHEPSRERGSSIIFDLVRPNMIKTLLEFSQSWPLYRQVNWNAGQLGDVPYFALTLGFTVLIFALEAYLDLRQLISFYTVKVLPKELIEHIPDETFKKSNAYGKDKFAFKMVESAFSFVEGLVFMFLGYLPYAWDMSRVASDKMGLFGEGYSQLFQEIVVTFIFVVLLTFDGNGCEPSVLFVWDLCGGTEAWIQQVLTGIVFAR